MTTAGLVDALGRLRDALNRTRLPFDLPSADAARDATRQVSAQLDDYVLPRLNDIGAPLLTVVGGSTGAGKSTLVNSLVGRVVSAAGVIRPTTKSPVLVMNPADEPWFATGRILPGLARTTGGAERPNQLRLVGEPSLPAGLAILDAPDIDSIVKENRQLAAQLLDAADLWLFVTSAARYSDAVPWEFLASAGARSAALAVVLDRVPPGAMQVVPTDLRRLMDQQGLHSAPLFTVPEALTDGLASEDAVAPIRFWLSGLASTESSRRRVVLQTLDGAIGALIEKAVVIANAADEQNAMTRLLESDASAAYREAERQASVQASDGSLLRGEVLARWHDYVGSTALGRLLDEKVSWLRDKLTSFFRGRPDGTEVKVAAEEGLRVLIVEAGEQAAERASAAWQAQPAGRALLDGHPELARVSPDFTLAVQRAVAGWQSDVLELVAGEGSGRRVGARIAAAGVSGVGVALMLVIFASTGGITGAEIGVAGGTTVVAQKLLESIFGDEAVRRLAATAKANLIARVDGLLAGELARYIALLDGLGVTPDAGQQIDQAVDAVRAERESGYAEAAPVPVVAVPVPVNPPPQPEGTPDVVPDSDDATTVIRVDGGEVAS